LSQGQSLAVVQFFFKGWDEAKRLDNMIFEMMGFHFNLIIMLFVKAHACLSDALYRTFPSFCD